MSSYTKKSYFIVFIICFLVIAAIIFGIVIFNGNLFSKRNGEVGIHFITDEKQIYLENTLPIADEVGKKLDGQGTKKGIQGYVEFSIKEESGIASNFEIFLKKSEVYNEIDTNYIKLYLTDMNDVAMEGFDSSIIPSYNSLRVSKENPGNKILYRGNIDKFAEKKYKLRVWLSDSSGVEIEKKAFKFDLGVRVY